LCANILEEDIAGWTNGKLYGLNVTENKTDEKE
jgi:hypothetical protein